MNDVLTALQRDLEPTGLTVHAGVWDCAARRWVLGEGPYVPDPFFEEGLIVAHTGGGRSVDIDAAGRPVPASLVDVLQEWVIEERWRGWPERYTAAGEFISILHPMTGPDGLVWWADHGRPLVRLGELATLDGVR